MPIYQVNELKTKFKNFLGDKFAKTKAVSTQPSLGIIMVGQDFASQKYIEMKLKMATEFGITAELFHFESNIDKNTVQATLNQFADKKGGLIFQLPVRADLGKLVNQIPAAIDVDLLGLERFRLLQGGLLPPTIGAIDLILKDILGTCKLNTTNFEEFMEQKLDLSGLNIAVIGQGVLVGWPLLEYLKITGASIISLNQDTQDIKNLTQNADIVISATGVGSLVDESWLKPSYVQNSLQFPIVIDAGTSEGKLSKKSFVDTSALDLDQVKSRVPDNQLEKSNNSIKTLIGDVNTQKVQNICTLVGVPGGVGPITVRYIFWNLYQLSLLNLNNKVK